MITDAEVTLLRGLTKKTPIATKLESGDRALLHAQWFVLELPLASFDSKLEAWEEEPLGGALEWRTLMPEGEGEYATAARFTNPDDGVPVIKLISDSTVAFIHTSIFEVVMKHVAEPEFRVFPAEKAYVAILSSGSLVGGTAQVKL